MICLCATCLAQPGQCRPSRLNILICGLLLSAGCACSGEFKPRDGQSDFQGKELLWEFVPLFD
jgi:hypothetical protein